MTGREWVTLTIVLGVILLALTAAWWLLRPRHGRHEQAERAAEVEADSFVAELRGLPAPGLDMYTDRNVRLLRTPPPPGRTLWQPPYAPAPLHEPRAERVASDTDVRRCAAPCRPAADDTPQPGRCACGQPAGHLEDVLRNADLDAIGSLFDTAQFEAVR